MEKRMNKLSLAFACLVLSLLLIVSFGCDNEKGGSSGGGGTSGVGFVVAYADADTLKFLPGDSASTVITIIVSDQNGNVMEGVP